MIARNVLTRGCGMAIWHEAKPKRTIDWREIAKDLREEVNDRPFRYRTRTFFK